MGTAERKLGRFVWRGRPRPRGFSKRRCHGGCFLDKLAISSGRPAHTAEGRGRSRWDAGATDLDLPDVC